MEYHPGYLFEITHRVVAWEYEEFKQKEYEIGEKFLIRNIDAGNLFKDEHVIWAISLTSGDCLDFNVLWLNNNSKPSVM